MGEQILSTKQIASTLPVTDKTAQRRYRDATVKDIWQAKKGSPIKFASEDLGCCHKGLR